MQDKTAGFVVRDYLSEAIDVDVSNAQWLEVNNLPDTETLCLLDDGEQRFERHYLQLRSAPKLTLIHLSYTPWVVHLDLTDNHDLLTIQGNIEHLDYCYDGVAIYIVRANRLTRWLFVRSIALANTATGSKTSNPAVYWLCMPAALVPYPNTCISEPQHRLV